MVGIPESGLSPLVYRPLSFQLSPSGAPGETVGFGMQEYSRSGAESLQGHAHVEGL